MSQNFCAAVYPTAKIKLDKTAHPHPVLTPSLSPRRGGSAQCALECTWPCGNRRRLHVVNNFLRKVVDKIEATSLNGCACALREFCEATVFLAPC